MKTLKRKTAYQIKATRYHSEFLTIIWPQTFRQKLRNDSGFSRNSKQLESLELISFTSTCWLFVRF